MSCVISQDPQLLRLTEAIAAKVGPQRFHVWFNNSTRLDLKPDALEISVPNDFISEWINSHFTKPIQEAAQEVLGGPLNVRFSVAPQLFDPRSATARSIAAGEPVLAVRPLPMNLPPKKAQPAVPTVASVVTQQRSRLRSELESFVVGPSNELAYNAACHVAQYPGGQYNPLFIHGGCGLGKTHLLQGICRRFMQVHPTRRFAYITGEEFTNDFVTAMRTGRLDAFRHRMRELDLLVIDDVHFLSGKKATQEEFLHTFNAIEASGRQLVMASDNHPKMIEEFGESLVNRFVSGMVVRVDAPNLQTRCEILRRVATRHHMTLSESVLMLIARRVTKNVRELEGAIARVGAYANLIGRPADEQIVQQALGETAPRSSKPVRPEDIVQCVCEYFNISHKDILSSRREQAISLPRAVAMYLIRRISGHSFPEIGRLLNKKNHSTVISACRRIEAAVQGNLPIEWTSPTGAQRENAADLLPRIEELCRSA